MTQEQLPLAEPLLTSGVDSDALRELSFKDTAVGFCILIRATVGAKLEYRVSTLLSLLASSLGYGVFLLVWAEVYRWNPDATALPRNGMFAYLITAIVLNATLTLAVETRVTDRLRLGLVATDLLRPLPFIGYQLAQALADVVVNLLLALPIYALGFAFISIELLPPSIGYLLVGALSAALALLINFGISYLVVQASFVTQASFGLSFARSALHQAFSGLAAPLMAFPSALREVAEFLPFRHVIETPVNILRGAVPWHEVPALIAAQATWAAALLGLSTSIFQAVLKRHQIQGG